MMYDVVLNPLCFRDGDYSHISSAVCGGDRRPRRSIASSSVWKALGRALCAAQTVEEFVFISHEYQPMLSRRFSSSVKECPPVDK